MFKVATNGGFLTLNKTTGIYDTHVDSRMATLFNSFSEADQHARLAVSILFGRVNQYYDIMISVSLLHVARRIYQKECDDARLARAKETELIPA